ncbi:M15 family metallopeptidase [Oerskovia turbata]
MESPSTSQSSDSRRARREAETGHRGRRRVEIASQHRWAPRMAVLGTLAVATIAMPLSAGAQDGPAAPYGPDGKPMGPSALDLVSDPAVPEPTSEYVASAPKIDGRAQAASRSVERAPLPNCDPTIEVTSANGRLTDHELCDLWQPGESLRPDAAVALSAMNEAFRSTFGRDMCLVSSYRTLASQVSIKGSRGGFAAKPGTSFHGWGLAIDLCSSETGNREVYSWITKNGGLYGWANPSWAKRGGGGAYEPWHFEFTEGVIEHGGLT